LRVLSHVCCGPCFTAVDERLNSDGLEVAAHFFNPNIHPGAEYRRRLIYVERYCRERSIPLIVGANDLKVYFNAINGHEEKPERCLRCYRLRLECTARAAVEGGFEAFTTSLLLSPYQFHDELRETAEAIGAQYGLAFLYYDLRPGFRRSIESAKAFGVYRQKYCGCVYSEHEGREARTRRQEAGKC